MSFFHKKDKASSTTSTEIPETTDTMIPQTEQAAIPIETDAPASTETTLHCTTTAHLMSYPLVKETVDFVEKVPGVETVNEVSKPALEFVQSQSLLKPIIETADKVGNYTLDLSDSVAPCLKTSAYEDITNTVEAPFIAASDAIQKSTKWTTETVEDSVCSPTRQMIKDFRAYYNEHLYDTKGKPLLRSSLDPMVRPVNNYMESVGKAWLPETEPLSHENATSTSWTTETIKCSPTRQKNGTLMKVLVLLSLMPCCKAEESKAAHDGNAQSDYPMYQSALFVLGVGLFVACAILALLADYFWPQAEASKHPPATGDRQR